MAEWSIDPSLLFSFLGLLLAIISLICSLMRDRKKDIQALENRLTTLEGNQFTADDRKMLKELEVKMSLFWNIIVKEAPKLLRQKLTPHFDMLLAKAESGISNLSETEKRELLSLLSEQYSNLTQGDVKDSGKALVLALYKGILEVEVSNQQD